MFLSCSLANVRYALLIVVITICLCSMAGFVWISTLSVYIFTPARKIDHNGEKFLAYLPHSGLSNQRTELENAMLVASYLNRTLILPPAFLGHMRGWQPGDELVKYMNALTKPQPWWYRCQDALSLADGPCHRKMNYATVPWEFLHSSITYLDIPIRTVQHVSLDNVKSILSLGDDEVHVHKDSSMYSWQLCDQPREKCPPLNSGGGHHYDELWTIEDLKEVKQPLLQLQGIFGTGRVSVSQHEHLKLRTQIREALIYRNPVLESVVDKIAERLGGKHQYWAIHMRMGDRQFQAGLAQHVAEQIEFLEKAVSGVGENSASTDCDTAPKIYVATDSKNPRKEPGLAPLFARFPCAAILDDFNDLLDPLDVALEVAQPPQQSVIKFFIPIIDSMVPANAQDFMGTPGSTYSAYIKRLHSAYRPTKYKPE